MDALGAYSDSSSSDDDEEAAEVLQEEEQKQVKQQGGRVEERERSGSVAEGGGWEEIRNKGEGERELGVAHKRDIALLSYLVLDSLVLDSACPHPRARPAELGWRLDPT